MATRKPNLSFLNLNLTAKELATQIGLVIAAALLVFWGIFMLLGVYTHHNDYIAVPDVSGLSYDEASIKLEQAGLRSAILDSVYNEKAKPYTIVEQNPKANDSVKEDRCIYLVINTGNKPKIKAPNLIDMSLTLAKAVLKNRGLTLGGVEYAYDPIGNNLVLDQIFQGRSLEEGTLIPKGSAIHLIVATTDKSRFPDADSTAVETDVEID
jgi:eukaryotic-like serine/threonine-protein kinase